MTMELSVQVLPSELHFRPDALVQNVTLINSEFVDVVYELSTLPVDQIETPLTANIPFGKLLATSETTLTIECKPLTRPITSCVYFMFRDQDSSRTKTILSTYDFDPDGTSSSTTASLSINETSIDTEPETNDKSSFATTTSNKDTFTAPAVTTTEDTTAHQTSSIAHKTKAGEPFIEPITDSSLPSLSPDEEPSKVTSSKNKTTNNTTGSFSAPSTSSQTQSNKLSINTKSFEMKTKRPSSVQSKASSELSSNVSQSAFAEEQKNDSESENTGTGDTLEMPPTPLGTPVKRESVQMKRLRLATSTNSPSSRTPLLLKSSAKHSKSNANKFKSNNKQLNWLLQFKVIALVCRFVCKLVHGCSLRQPTLIKNRKRQRVRVLCITLMVLLLTFFNLLVSLYFVFIDPMEKYWSELLNQHQLNHFKDRCSSWLDNQVRNLTCLLQN